MEKKNGYNQQVNPDQQMQEDLAEQESRMMDEGGGVVTSAVNPDELTFRQGDIQS